MSSRCIRDTVNKVKTKYQENDPFRLAAAMKIIVQKLPLETAPNCCKGFCMRESRKTYIVINCNLPELLDFKFRMMKRSGVQIVDSPITANGDFLKDIPTQGIIGNY